MWHTICLTIYWHEPHWTTLNHPSRDLQQQQAGVAGSCRQVGPSGQPLVPVLSRAARDRWHEHARVMTREIAMGSPLTFIHARRDRVRVFYFVLTPMYSFPLRLAYMMILYLVNNSNEQIRSMRIWIRKQKALPRYSPQSSLSERFNLQTENILFCKKLKMPWLFIRSCEWRLE